MGRLHQSGMVPRHALLVVPVKDAPEVLVKVGICDFLQRLNLVHWDEVAVQIHKLNGNLNAGRRGGKNWGLLPAAILAVISGSMQPQRQQGMHKSLLPVG